MTKAQHFNDVPAVRPATGYSHAVAASGRVIAVAGQVAMDEHGELVGPSDPRAQAERVFENLQAILAAAGATFADVIKFGVFTVDIAYLPVIREIRDRYVGGGEPPASTAVEVGALFQPGYLIEIDALAVLPE